ncbi:uncharacterized protein LOC120268495 [Dioscorea cayenensis subsp. rotundata]|uniref:Uncharacterized protein LOC120268495 n=1 Tax=Dioscorea cayennensis subsp. rotundata TaxID=55577 RepID=A0AB40BXH5_DIOCR|nr:uncharacterized protein LOC120268495 [Dioscorea cayenensis subsp. rotundata]
MSFTDEDLLLGTTVHNRPLYVTRFCDGVKINRVLVDPWSSLNLMTLNTLRTLALEVCHLSSEKIIIQGFNQHSQKALGSITLPLKFGKISSNVKFHVIDADASYKALLGRPWIHENQLVPSTLYQCAKYVVDGEEFKIDEEIQPFGIHEIHYEDARYYLNASKSTKGVKLPCPEEVSLIKTAKTTPVLQKREPMPPHFGSDTESSKDESDADIHQSKGQVERSTEENALYITRIPDGLYKSLYDLKWLDDEVAVHKLVIDPNATSVKQAPRKMKFDLEERKNGQIRICVDFRVLSKACPKDDFPLPVMEIMIDNTSGYEMFFFMDGYSGYNQIKMHPDDQKNTAFRTTMGIYCYRGTKECGSNILKGYGQNI